MGLYNWRGIFQTKATDLDPKDSWNLEFDDTLEPDSPNPGWAQYIKSTSARWFRCSQCQRSFPSNHVIVLFHMRLANGQGTVKVRRFKQNCKICKAAPMESPSVDDDNIGILLENLVEKIRVKCYHEPPKTGGRQFVNIPVQNPHEPSHCEGCIAGICIKKAPGFQSWRFCFPYHCNKLRNRL
ncbi:receptor-transporting protein 2-like [Brachionichthys hirsutus]|uniref:receptor-transporting protein 2-like n=1 Tax=Brachionichthys hirsutus TaxID=412623 RepID=UPI003604862C